ncbi:MAG: hypothetical protein KDC09_15685 [Bacteroidales bacterium]|nr:hypothetical protein [Bacteroidales bacterium]
MKTLFIFIVVFYVHSISYSQEKIKLPINEISLGVNRLISNKYQYEPRFGYGVSIKKIWFKENQANLVSGLLFEKTTYVEQNPPCAGVFCSINELIYNVYSFSIPLFMRFNTGNNYKLFIETGPAFEIVPLKWGIGTETVTLPNQEQIEIKISGDYSHDIINIGANFGVGFEFPVKSVRFVIITYYHDSIKYWVTSKRDYLSKYFSCKLGIKLN